MTGQGGPLGEGAREASFNEKRARTVVHVCFLCEPDEPGVTRGNGLPSREGW